MGSVLSFSRPDVAIAVRTLVLAGYTIENNRRQPTHTELTCTAPFLGTNIRLLIALTQDDELSDVTRENLKTVADRDGRTLVLVAALGGDGYFGWDDFMEVFGGAVPSWRALGSGYIHDLKTTAKNIKPQGCEIEAWRLFEQLVAAGLEFCFARRVRRLGAAKRGQRVSDMITQIPEGDVLVLDAKSTGSSFNAAIHELRPLVEYVKNQKIRQKGSFNLFGALVVAPAFDQDEASLSEISKEFVAETGVPIAFLTVSVMEHFIDTLRNAPQLRGSLRWRRIFSGGIVSIGTFDSEIDASKGERY